MTRLATVCTLWRLLFHTPKRPNCDTGSMFCASCSPMAGGGCALCPGPAEGDDNAKDKI